MSATAVADSTGSSKAPQMAKYLALLADGGHLGRATDKAGPREMNGRGKRQAAGPTRDFSLSRPGSCGLLASQALSNDYVQPTHAKIIVNLYKDVEASFCFFQPACQAVLIQFCCARQLQCPASLWKHYPSYFTTF